MSNQMKRTVSQEMISSVITVRAPSNIALVKYMGKKDSQLNLPENPSLSLTLNDLSTIAEVRWILENKEFENKESIVIEGKTVCLPQIDWVAELPARVLPSESPLPRPFLSDGLSWSVPVLEAKGISKVQKHFNRVAEAVLPHLIHWGLEGNWENLSKGRIEIRTANNFPPASGVASSASSFAAMTLGFAAILAKDTHEFEKIFIHSREFQEFLAGVSRQGSGSSCRSFHGPWVGWDRDQVSQITSARDEASLPFFGHLVVLVRSSPKEVGSSEAHLRVKTSPLWEGRAERATRRYHEMAKAIEKGDLKRISELAWEETWEMHSLFHTAVPPFTYWEPETLALLKWFSGWVGKDPSAPIVTLDAGPNVHVLVERSARQRWKEKILSQFPTLTVLEDEQGQGARILEVTER